MWHSWMFVLNRYVCVCRSEMNCDCGLQSLAAVYRRSVNSSRSLILTKRSTFTRYPQCCRDIWRLEMAERPLLRGNDSLLSQYLDGKHPLHCSGRVQCQTCKSLHLKALRALEAGQLCGSRISWSQKNNMTTEIRMANMFSFLPFWNFIHWAQVCLVTRNRNLTEVHLTQRLNTEEVWGLLALETATTRCTTYTSIYNIHCIQNQFLTDDLYITLMYIRVCVHIYV